MDTLLPHVNKFYGIQALSMERVIQGFLSENYIIFTADKKYFLKKYRFDKEERIKQIHEVKKFFAEREIPVVLPIVNNENKTFFLFEDGYFALFPFVEGVIANHKELTNTQIISMGQLLAKIHLAGKNAKERVKTFRYFSENFDEIERRLFD